MSPNPLQFFRAAAPRLFLSCLLVAAILGQAGLIASTELSDQQGPPVFPDLRHVHNGCHVSALVYLARIAAEFPGEHGQTTIAVLRNADGSVKPHTLALVTWRGEWWCRDEYFGVFPLHCVATAPPDLRHLKRLYKNHAALVARCDSIRPLESAVHLSVNQRHSDATAVATKLPFPNTIYWVSDGRNEVPIVFFRPGTGRIAVYDPARGTAVAECAPNSDVRVAAAVSARLGYRPESIRADITAVEGGLLVAASPTGRVSGR